MRMRAMVCNMLLYDEDLKSLKSMNFDSLILTYDLDDDLSSLIWITPDSECPELQPSLGWHSSPRGEVRTKHQTLVSLVQLTSIVVRSSP